MKFEALDSLSHPVAVSYMLGAKHEGLMNLVELKFQLNHLKGGQMTIIPYDEYSDLFPAGEPDQIVHTDSFHFAKANGCHVVNRPSEQQVWIIKNA